LYFCIGAPLNYADPSAFFELVNVGLTDSVTLTMASSSGTGVFGVDCAAGLNGLVFTSSFMSVFGFSLHISAHPPAGAAAGFGAWEEVGYGLDLVSVCLKCEFDFLEVFIVIKL
jgi:hypothetical protein